jgi:surfactin synthase thioesterase subunit
MHLADALAEAITLTLAGPFAVFGHSLGGHLGFELCRALERRHAPRPQCLIVSAAAPHAGAAPGLAEASMPVSDLEIIEQLRRLGGTPDALLEAQSLSRRTLEVLRADFQMARSYKLDIATPLPLPIAALGGEADTAIPPQRLAAWQTLTTDKFSTQVFEGGHFFHLERPRLVTSFIQTLLNPGRPIAKM